MATVAACADPGPAALPDAGPLRVLLVCGAYDPRLDGVSDYVARLADALDAGGALVRILHTGPASRDPRAVRAGGAWSPAALLRARAAIAGADVVHVQFAPSMYAFRGWIGLLPLVLRGAALVTTVHEYGWWRWERRIPGRLWRLLERAGAADRETGLLVPRSRSVVATNGGHAAALAARFRRAPVAVIPIGANVGVDPAVDPAAARREVREELGVAPGATLLAFFGFVHPVKGVRYLAEAVAALAAEGRDVHLLVVGGFESMALPGREAVDFEAELRARIQAAGAAARTKVTGFLGAREISRLLRAADAGVLPFTHGVTAKSGSLLTVLGHGLPTVVTAPPEPEPELQDGQRCVVVPVVRDGGALAAGIRRVLDDPALAARIAAAGERWAAERDWAVIAGRHRDVYRRVLP